METQLQEQISDVEWQVPNFISFGSWIGGDRDGNPNVTPEITWETLQMQRKLILKKYDASIVELMKRFSQSSERVPIKQQVIDRVETAENKYLKDDEKWLIKSEIYRRKFAVILKRLRATGKTNDGYDDAEELVEDLVEIKENAEAHLKNTKKMKTIRKVIRQVEMFGFHLATLDVRNHSGEHEAAVREILKTDQLTEDYSALTEEEKQKILCQVLSDPKPVLLSNDQYSQATQDMMKVFNLIKKAHEEFGKRSIEVYLVSMTESPSDLLEVLFLAKEAGIYRIQQDGTVESDIDVATLLETIEDLIAGPKIMKVLFETEVYHKQLH